VGILPRNPSNPLAVIRKDFILDFSGEAGIEFQKD
jgi:hypothetical protein